MTTLLLLFVAAFAVILLGTLAVYGAAIVAGVLAAVWDLAKIVIEEPRS